jgi:hypothetical protein
MLATPSAKELAMPDPIVPPPGDETSEPPTPRQDHAVLAWLAVEAELPESVQLHLLDALNAWSPLMGPYLFPTEPEGGAGPRHQAAARGDVVAPERAGFRCAVARQGRAERAVRPAWAGDR